MKKIGLMDFSRSRKGGIIACTLDEKDVLIGVGITGGEDEIILATKTGMSIRFAESTVRAMGRIARGVRGIALDEGDVVGSRPFRPAASQSRVVASRAQRRYLLCAKVGTVSVRSSKITVRKIERAKGSSIFKPMNGTVV